MQQTKNQTMINIENIQSDSVKFSYQANINGQHLLTLGNFFRMRLSIPLLWC